MRILGFLSIALLSLMCASELAPPAAAGEILATPKSSEERHNLRADIIRERAAARARAQLGLPSLGSGYAGDPQQYAPNRYVDFLALGAQMARIAIMLNATASCLSGALPCQPYGYPPAFPPGPQGQAAMGAAPGAAVPGALASVYGPAGPTAESVRALLTYRLVVAGNPRLVIGEVSEDEDQVVAEVVTTDGSLVERYAVDKRTGVWRTHH